jgi:hypothetical protein
MRTRLATLVVLPLAVLVLTASPAAALPVVFRATLTGAAVPTGGDPAGSGIAWVVVDDAADRICVVTFSQGGTLPFAAHIHHAPVGELGPHAVDLNNPITFGTGGTSSGCYTAPEAVLDDIAANPSDYYVNIHSHEYPLGSLRGQLTPVTAP